MSAKTAVLIVDVFRDKWITYDTKKSETVMKFVNFRHMSTMILEIINRISLFSKKVTSQRDLYTNENAKMGLIKQFKMLEVLLFNTENLLVAEDEKLVKLTMDLIVLLNETVPAKCEDRDHISSTQLMERLLLVMSVALRN